MKCNPHSSTHTYRRELHSQSNPLTLCIIWFHYLGVNPTKTSFAFKCAITCAFTCMSKPPRPSSSMSTSLESTSGGNPLRCTIKDKKDLVLSTFFPYVLIFIKTNESKLVKYFTSTIFVIIIILNSINVFLLSKKGLSKKIKKGNIVTRFWNTLKNLDPIIHISY